MLQPAMRKSHLLLVLLTAAVWAQPPELVVHELTDPGWVVVNVDNRWVVHDRRGFFVGYYVPLAPVSTREGYHYSAGNPAASDHGVHDNEHGVPAARSSQGYASSHGQAPGTGSFQPYHSTSTFSFRPYNGGRYHSYSGYRRRYR